MLRWPNPAPSAWLRRCRRDEPARDKLNAQLGTTGKDTAHIYGVALQ